MPSRDIPILAGVVYHVTNRARDGVTLFDSRRAYDAFVALIAETQAVRPTRLLAYCVMSNHWHFVLWPETDDAVERFVGWLSLTHAKRFHQWHGSTGAGCVYPRRFDARPVEAEGNLYRVVRYVERNPCAAGLAASPDAWRWSSAARTSPIRLSPWPAPRPPNWSALIAQPIETTELKRIRACLKGEPSRRLRRRIAVSSEDPATHE